MNLYLLQQQERSGYDTYDSCVIAAETSYDAKRIHPATYQEGEWWLDKFVSSSWASHPKNVKVTYIGVAGKKIKKGVICASFNAG